MHSAMSTADVTTFGEPCLRDSTTKLGNAGYFGVCLPLRIVGGVGLALGGSRLGPRGSGAVVLLLLALAAGFAYSGRYLPERRSSWKNYVRPTAALCSAAAFGAAGRWDLAGSMIAGDALAGLQARHSAAVAFKCAA